MWLPSFAAFSLLLAAPVSQGANPSQAMPPATAKLEPQQVAGGEHRSWQWQFIKRRLQLMQKPFRKEDLQDYRQPKQAQTLLHQRQDWARKVQRSHRSRPCSKDKECGYAPFHPKRCGGFTGYLAFSRRNKKADAFLFNLENYNSVVSRLNELSAGMMMGTCEVSPQPEAHCHKKRCRLRSTEESS